ncbi:hypothetical protein L6452_18212 [Arctium lappa]|uniref:Uncharacterized protein n=1 Tax=Arctium lappa TaxID=4217 RepID=A0ACB9C5L2_ARCLA|nr:hypothetical protein L6452_18212 [Arctium lappa]
MLFYLGAALSCLYHGIFITCGIFYHGCWLLPFDVVMDMHKAWREAYFKKEMTNDQIHEPLITYITIYSYPSSLHKTNVFGRNGKFVQQFEVDGLSLTGSKCM